MAVERNIWLAFVRGGGGSIASQKHGNRLLPLKLIWEWVDGMKLDHKSAKGHHQTFSPEILRKIRYYFLPLTTFKHQRTHGKLNFHQAAFFSWTIPSEKDIYWAKKCSKKNSHIPQTKSIYSKKKPSFWIKAHSTFPLYRKLFFS